MSDAFWYVLRVLVAGVCGLFVVTVLIPMFVMLVAKAWSYGMLTGRQVFEESNKKKDGSDERK